MHLTDLLHTLSERLSALWPETPSLIRRDLEKNIHAILQSTFSRLDLVTREEFDIQTQVLARCRERIAALEKTLSTFESGQSS